MRIRAVIFDVYGTLLELGPAPPGAEEEWRRTWLQLLDCEPRLNQASFSAACEAFIRREHETARGRGIQFPEVDWPAIVLQAVPEVRALSPTQRQTFLLRLRRAGQTTHLSAETAEVLRALRATGCLLGIASNAQAYTLRELEAGLDVHGLGTDIFEPSLSFWSYQHGFSKPDPYVFQLLSARLRLLGVLPAEAVMVGDRSDNDIEPARRHEWQTWQIYPAQHAGRDRWKEFLAALS